MPILETVVGGYFVGKGAIAAGTAVGGFVFAAGGYLFGRSSAGKESEEAKAQLVRLTEIKEEREDARVQNINEVFDGIEQRKLHLDEEALKHRQQMESLATGFDEDNSVMHEQTEVLGRTNLELEQCVKDQQAMLLAVQREFKEKMETLERTQKELLESKAQFEQKSQELVEAKEQISTAKKELTQVRQELSAISKENREKDIKISGLEKKIDQKTQLFENELMQSKLTIEEITSKNETYKNLVKSLTEELEEAKSDKKSPSPTPRFFS